MAAVTSTIAAGSALAGIGMNIGQMVQANKQAKAAQQNAAEAAKQIENLKEVNALSQVQVPTLGFDLAQQGIDRYTQAALSSAKGAGAEGVIGSVGQIGQVQNEQELNLAAQANEMKYQRDMAEAEAQQGINQRRVGRLNDLEQARLEGAQLAAYNAQNKKVAAIQGIMGSAGTLAGALGNPETGLIPLYQKKKAASTDTKQMEDYLSNPY